MYKDKAYREIMILTKMNHPNVITLYEYFESQKYITIIMNNVKGKPLLKSLEDFKHDYTTKRILKILWQLSKAVRHLKAKDIIWCNFNHNNIIYNGDDVVICGFSNSRVKVQRDKKQAQSILGLRGTEPIPPGNRRRRPLRFARNDRLQVLRAEARRVGLGHSGVLSVRRPVPLGRRERHRDLRVGDAEGPGLGHSAEAQSGHQDHRLHPRHAAQEPQQAADHPAGDGAQDVQGLPQGGGEGSPDRRKKARTRKRSSSPTSSTFPKWTCSRTRF